MVPFCSCLNMLNCRAWLAQIRSYIVIYYINFTSIVFPQYVCVFSNVQIIIFIVIMCRGQSIYSYMFLHLKLIMFAKNTLNALQISDHCNRNIIWAVFFFAHFLFWLTTSSRIYSGNQKNLILKINALDPLLMSVRRITNIIKSEVWTITHCLGLGHETMVCAVCLSIVLFL